MVSITRSNVWRDVAQKLYNPFLANDVPSLRLDAAGYPKKSFLTKFRFAKYFSPKVEVSKRIDLVSRVSFPGLFCLFLCKFTVVLIKMS